MQKFVFAFLIATFAWQGASFAQGGYPDEYALRPLQLPSGMAQVRVPVVIGLSKNSAGSPVNIPFEIRFGLTRELEMRLYHPGNGLCLKGCGRRYNDLGLGFLYSVMHEGNMELSLLGAFDVVSFSDPALVRIDLGVAYKYFHSPFSVATSPFISLGMNRRNQNGDGLAIPVEFAYQLSPPMALFFESGIFGALDNFGDSWSMPLGVGINYLLNRGMDIGAEFKFTNLIGNGGGADGRLILVYFSWRF